MNTMVTQEEKLQAIVELIHDNTRARTGRRIHDDAELELMDKKFTFKQLQELLDEPITEE